LIRDTQAAIMRELQHQQGLIRPAGRQNKANQENGVRVRIVKAHGTASCDVVMASATVAYGWVVVLIH
jgi:hypothetical protein